MKTKEEWKDWFIEKALEANETIFKRMSMAESDRVLEQIALDLLELSRDAYNQGVRDASQYMKDELDTETGDMVSSLSYSALDMEKFADIVERNTTPDQ